MICTEEIIKVLPAAGQRHLHAECHPCRSPPSPRLRVAESFMPIAHRTRVMVKCFPCACQVLGVWGGAGVAVGPSVAWMALR